MAIITFPRQLPTGVTFSGCKFRPAYLSELAATRGGGKVAKDLGPTLWVAEYQSSNLDEATFGVARAWLDSIGTTGTFFAHDILREYPVEYSTGWPFSPAFGGQCVLTNVESNNVEAVLAGLPAGFIFAPGDYLSFNYGAGPSRALHRVQQAATASGAGTVTVEVRPHIRTGWQSSPSLPVYLHKAAAIMHVYADRSDEDVKPGRYGTISFSAVQTLTGVAP